MYLIGSIIRYALIAATVLIIGAVIVIGINSSGARAQAPMPTAVSVATAIPGNVAITTTSVPVATNALAVTVTPSAKAILSPTSAPTGAAFDFKFFGNTQVIDTAVMKFPAWVTWRVGIDFPGGKWSAAAYFLSSASHLSINRLVCDDTCLKVVYHPAGGADVTLLDKAQAIDLFNMVWVGGKGAAQLPAEVVKVIQSRGVATEEILAQNVYALFLGDVPKGSWIEFVFEDDETLQVNKGSSISLTADTDQMTRSPDGTMVKGITYFVKGMEAFRWTNTGETFGGVKP